MNQIIGIDNNYNNCFINCALQILLNLPLTKTLLLTDSVLNIVFDNNEYTVNISKFYQFLLKNHQIKYNKQGDYHEILLWILGKNQQLEYIFTGINLKILICQFGHKYQNKEQFNYIPLFDNNIEQSFQTYIQSSNVTDYYCKQCNKNVKATLTNQIIKSPDILTFHIPCKNNNIYSLSRNYRIRTFNNQIIFYYLYATVHHIGSQSQGHYNCQIIKDNNIYLIDDKIIKLQNKLIDQNITTIFLVNKNKI